jgi:hypothetical protein
VNSKRNEFYGSFSRAHRSTTPSGGWAVLETAGHSSGYWGYSDLDSDSRLSSKTYDFVGLSPRIKGGRELAVQRNCHLVRSTYTLKSECDSDFSDAGFLILYVTPDGKQYVYGLVTGTSSEGTGKQRVYALTTSSMRQYGATLAELRRDQDTRYAAIEQQRLRRLLDEDDRSRQRSERDQPVWAQVMKGVAAISTDILHSFARVLVIQRWSRGC